MINHDFARFLEEYERRSEKEYDFLRPIVKEVVERYLDSGKPRSGLPSSGVRTEVRSVF